MHRFREQNIWKEDELILQDKKLQGRKIERRTMQGKVNMQLI